MPARGASRSDSSGSTYRLPSPPQNDGFGPITNRPIAAHRELLNQTSQSGRGSAIRRSTPRSRTLAWLMMHFSPLLASDVQALPSRWQLRRHRETDSRPISLLVDVAVRLASGGSPAGANARARAFLRGPQSRSYVFQRCAPRLPPSGDGIAIVTCETPN